MYQMLIVIWFIGPRGCRRSVEEPEVWPEPRETHRPCFEMLTFPARSMVACDFRREYLSSVDLDQF